MPPDAAKFHSFPTDHPNHVPATRIVANGVEMEFFTPNRRLVSDAVRFATIEPDLVEWIDGLPVHSVLYDVGASNGAFSVYAACLGHVVVAFEPETQNFAVLEMNNYLNSHQTRGRLIPLPVALSDRGEIGKIFVRDNVPGTHMKILDRPETVVEGKEFEAKHIQHTIKDRLDDLVARYKLPAPTAIKIDVDGHEIQLLNGAVKTLSAPELLHVFIEIAHPEDKGSEAHRIVTAAGFQEVGRQRVESYEHLYNVRFQRA